MIRETDAFKAWIKGLRDRAAVGRINFRLKQLAAGNPGDPEPVGDGVSELRIHFSPGYRVYYKIFTDGTIILFGGDKDDQPRNVRRAKDLAKSIDGDLARTKSDERKP